MRSFASWALVSLALLVASPAFAQRKPESVRWIGTEAGGIAIYSSSTPLVTIEVAEKLQRMRATLARARSLNTAAPPLPARMFLYVDSNDFRLVSRQAFGARTRRPAVFVSHGKGYDMAIDLAARRDSEAVVYHELVHLFIENTWKRVPLWLNEGLAEYYSTFETDDKYAYLGRPIASYRRRLRRIRNIPLNDLFATTITSPLYNGGVEQSMFYATSWNFVHYLFHSRKNGAAQLERFRVLLFEGTPTNEAFVTAFGITMKQMEAELAHYVRRPQLTWERFPLGDEAKIAPIAEPKVIDRNEMQGHLDSLTANVTAFGEDIRTLSGIPQSESQMRLRAEATRADELLVEGNTAEALEKYRDLAETADPNLRKKANETIPRIEAHQKRVSQIERYNKAFELAGLRDFDGALKLLDAILAEGGEEDVIAAAKDMREQILAKQ